MLARLINFVEGISDFDIFNNEIKTKTKKLSYKEKLEFYDLEIQKFKLLMEEERKRERNMENELEIIQFGLDRIARKKEMLECWRLSQVVHEGKGENSD